MRNLIIIFLALLLSNQGQAQLKFKKVYPDAMAASKEEAFDLFMEYQKQDPDHVNTYYQLGEISLAWMFSYDPLVSYEDVSKYSRDATLYYGLAKHKLNEKDVRKYRDYFQSIKPMVGEKIQFEDVRTYLDSIFAVVELYKEKTAKINTYFNKSIDLYNTCVDQYMYINNRNARMKDMVLTIDDATIREARSLKQNYDSALIYFQKYSNEVSTYDLVKYNQQLKVHPISTYRLEGLSQQNFLKPEINVYDYGKWVDELFQTLDNDISALRNEIVTADESFDEEIGKLKQPETLVNKDYKLYRLTDKLKYQISKFDNNSLVVDWFLYRDAQVELFSKRRMPLLNETDSTPYPLVRRAQVFEEIIDAQKIAAQKLKRFDESIAPQKISKYPKLFGEVYKGENGLRNSVSKQEIMNQDFMEEAFAHLDSYRQKTESQGAVNDSAFVFNNAEVPQPDTIAISDLGNNAYKTMKVELAESGGWYISGLFKVNSKIVKPFVAYSQDGVKIDWLRKLNIKGIRYADDIILKLLPKGSAALIHGGASAEKTNVNVVVRLDEFGNDQTKTILQSGSLPHDFMYDDINETVLSILKGESKETIEKDKLLVYFNKLDATPIWSLELAIEGEFAGVLKMDQNYLLFSNFKTFNDGTTTHESSTVGGYNVCSTSISLDGTINTWEKYLNPKPIEITQVLKLNSNSINLLGESGTPEAEEKEFVYILLDANGKLRYQKQ